MGVDVADLTKIYDVLVIGGGNAGMCAAITARQAGASVLVLEHAPRGMRGGNSRHTRNLRTMHEAPTATLTESYGEAEYYDDLLKVTGGKTDEKLARLTIRSTLGAVNFLGQCGVVFQPALTGTLSLSRTNAFFLGGGKALLNAAYATAERQGVSVVYDAEVRDVIMENGVARGVEATVGGYPATIMAKSIVAAAGGFQANIPWMKEYWGDAADNFLIRGTPYAKGRVLKSLLGQNIESVGDATQCHAVAIDGRAPQFDGGITTRLDCVPFSIVVNRDANRFYNEGEDVWPKRYAIWGRLVAQQPGQVAYSIIDSKAKSLFMPSVYPAIKADTLAELAGKLGLNAAALEATVAEFNRCVRPGTFKSTQLDGCTTEGLTPPKTNWARTIDTGPFYGYPLRPGITFTYLGVKVDENARVQMTTGSPTRNLYATGEIMAGSILGQGYLAGFGMAIGAVFGRIAGREAAKHAQD